MYVSGFGAGTDDFGWVFGPAPFENFVAPGIRTVHAILAVRKDTHLRSITLNARRCWAKQEKRYPIPVVDWFIKDCEEDPNPISIKLTFPTRESGRLRVESVSYVPVPLRQTSQQDSGVGSQQSPEATGIHEVLVSDEEMASELQFCGSPTIRINGRDVEGESRNARSFALSCRLYPGSKQVGLPPAEMVHRAVLKARRKLEGTSGQ